MYSQKYPHKTIEFCNAQIKILENDIKKIKGLVSDRSLEILEQEINSNNKKIKEAELQIKYIDYQ